MQQSKLNPVWSLLPFVVVACGSVDHASGTSMEAAPVEIAKAVCPKAYDCCMPSQLMENDMAGTDEPSCETATADGFRDQLAAVDASQKAGRSIYDGDKLKACLDKIRSSTCAELNTTNHFTGVPGCDSFVKPVVGLGGACTFDWECLGGWCELPENASGDGTCRQRAAEGEACADTMCASNLVCSDETSTCTTVTAPTPADSCFYSSGCAEAGHTSPTLLGLALLGATLLTRLRRRPQTPTP